MLAWTVLACLVPGAHAQEAPLTAEAVLASSAAYFPSILQSLAQRRGAAAKVLEADGAFDVVFGADGFSRVAGYYDGSVISGGSRQNLRPLGSSLYLDYRLSDGDFPIYEDGQYTNQGGEIKLGFLFSLLRDRTIDERRFGQMDAQIGVRQADLDLLLTRLGVQQRALIAYSRWLAAGYQLDVYENLLQIALDRQTALAEQVRSGARAEIFLVENRQNIVRRQTFATNAMRDFQVAAIGLSYYYRDPSAAPLIPERAALPPTPPIAVLDDLSVNAASGISQALARRPELHVLQAAVERAQNQLALARNALKPRLDMSVALARDLGSVAEGGVSRDPAEAVLGFNFAVPLQQRTARGRLSQRTAEIDALEQRQRLTGDQIQIEVQNFVLALNTAQTLLELAVQEVEQSEIMRLAEERRFDSGASDFFLVNIREETAANARIHYYSAELERRIARANYDAATVDLVRLGLDEEVVAR